MMIKEGRVLDEKALEARGDGRGAQRASAAKACGKSATPVTPGRKVCRGRTRSRTLVFDIETGPLGLDELAAMMPPFDPEAVKTGNLKDPEKIGEKIRNAKAQHVHDFARKAALDPLTGRVIAIGVMEVGVGEDAPEFELIAHDDEAETLRAFWDRVRGDAGRVHELVGFNLQVFDLPFLIRRSWRHRVAIPIGLRRGRYWSEQVIDLREVWQLGDRQARGSLDTIAKHLDVGAKTGDGKDFAELWVKDRQAAEAYLRNDVEMTANVARRVGVV